MSILTNILKNFSYQDKLGTIDASINDSFNILILTSKGVIKDWDTIPALIILLREITVSGLREYLAGIKISIPVSRIAKAKTFLQLAALGLLILSESNLNLLFIIILNYADNHRLL